MLQKEVPNKFHSAPQLELHMNKGTRQSHVMFTQLFKISRQKKHLKILTIGHFPIVDITTGEVLVKL